MIVLAQEGSLDVTDGETLYEDGWLLTTGYEFTNPRMHEATLGAFYGLRHDFQVGVTAPYEWRGRGCKFGDVTALAKWRFHRWDIPHETINFAALAGLQMPTGSSTWDPIIGAGATYEPYQWRVNAFAYYKPDDVFAELALGNRFWQLPYPGPFMRADAFAHYRRQNGRDLMTLGANWAFRPQPSLDFQIEVEVPVTESAENLSIFLVFGYRI